MTDKKDKYNHEAEALAAVLIELEGLSDMAVDRIFTHVKGVRSEYNKNPAPTRRLSRICPDCDTHVPPDGSVHACIRIKNKE